MPHIIRFVIDAQPYNVTEVEPLDPPVAGRDLKIHSAGSAPRKFDTIEQAWAVVQRIDVFDGRTPFELIEIPE